MEPHHLEYMFYPPQCTPQAKRKKPNPFRVRLLLLCFYHYISVPPSAHRRKTAGLPVLSSGRCFPPGGASCCFHGPFPGRVIYLFCFSPRQLRQTFGAFCFSLFFLRRFCPVAKSGIRSTAKALDFPKGKSGLFFCFILLILFRILPKKPGKNNPRGEMK